MQGKHIQICIFVASLGFVVSGCGQRELDCNHPRSQKEQQECAKQGSEEGPIKPTEKPKDWLDLNKSAR